MASRPPSPFSKNFRTLFTPSWYVCETVAFPVLCEWSSKTTTTLSTFLSPGTTSQPLACGAPDEAPRHPLLTSAKAATAIAPANHWWLVTTLVVSAEAPGPAHLPQRDLS